MTPPDSLICYKSTGPQGESNFGTGKWHLPTQNSDGSWTPGAWRIAYGPKIIPCDTGVHACRREDLIYWLGDEIWEFELAGGELVVSDDKIVNRKGRLLRPLAWNTEIARAWVDDTRKYYGWTPVDWTDPHWAQLWAPPSVWGWVSPWTSRSEWPSAWAIDRLFEYLEGRRTP